MPNQDSPPSFFARLKLAARVLSDAAFAQRIGASLQSPAPAPAQVPSPVPPVAAPSVAKTPAPERAPEPDHASGLTVLSILQREGRLIDFLQEDVAAFSDAEIGAAARVVHAGSRKVLAQYFTLEPILKETEGASITVKPGFDARRIRLTGNVAGQPPFHGSVKHHGWVATEVRLPSVSSALDARVVAPAEVEL